jgi:hypothetical protein
MELKELKLTDLKPKFTRWAGLGKYGSGSFAFVKTLKEADNIWFLCPKCFASNGGSKGTHAIRIDFREGQTPDANVMHNKQGQPVRWAVQGTGFDDLTLSPSILIEGGCAWHGFIQNGKIVNA